MPAIFAARAARRAAHARLSHDRVRRRRARAARSISRRDAPCSGSGERCRRRDDVRPRARRVLASRGRSGVALPLLPIVGAGMMVQMAATNTIIQTIVDEDKRGRVMGFYTMAFLGTAPIGSLIAGVAADRIGPRDDPPRRRRMLAAGMWFCFACRCCASSCRPIYVSAVSWLPHRSTPRARRSELGDACCRRRSPVTSVGTRVAARSVPVIARVPCAREWQPPRPEETIMAQDRATPSRDKKCQETAAVRRERSREQGTN